MKNEHIQQQLNQQVPDASDWLALSLLPRLGAGRLKQWHHERRAWPQQWLEALSVPQRHYFLYLRHPQGHGQVLQPMLDWCTAESSRALLHPDHPAWPALLNELPDPPPVLWAWGNLACLEQPAIAIVGSRHPSSAGRHHAQAFARALAEAGSCIVSGMALGIDAQAHEGALSAEGATIAVVGSGLDHTYPRQHRSLQQRILNAGGLLLSEHPPATEARPAFFPRRNRIITGLSRGVLVVEAALRSGSLISARLALEQNRDVFALPGALEASLSAGCHALIRQGATLVTTPTDIIEELGGPWPASSIQGAENRPACREGGERQRAGHDLQAQRWLVLLRDGAVSLDELVLRSGCSVSDTLNALLALELAGQVVMCGNGWTLSAPSSESGAQTR